MEASYHVTSSITLRIPCCEETKLAMEKSQMEREMPSWPQAVSAVPMEALWWVGEEAILGIQPQQNHIAESLPDCRTTKNNKLLF